MVQKQPFPSIFAAIFSRNEDMVMITITRAYDTRSDAENVVSMLKDDGIPTDSISVMTRSDTSAGYNVDADATDTDTDGVGTGAGVGGVLGGGVGLLAGLGLMAIPGVGPIVAAGWLASAAAGAAAGAVAGAATGGIVSSMTEGGMDEDDANTHAEAVRRGATIVSVRTEDTIETRVNDIMDGSNPADLTTRRAGWEAEGWSGYMPNARPFTTSEIEAERNRYRS
jgi:hypothetical protein